MGLKYCSHLFCPLLGEKTIAVFLPQRTGVTGNNQPDIGRNGTTGQSGQQQVLFGLRQLSTTKLEMDYRKPTGICGFGDLLMAGSLTLVEGAGQDEGFPVRHLYNLAQQGKMFLTNLPGHEW